MKNFFKLLRTGCILLSLFVFVLISCNKPKTNVYENYSWVEEVRDNHPRLFINKSSFKEVKKRALNDEREIFEDMKSRVDKLIGEKIEFPDSLERDGSANSNHMYGTKAAEAAFVYLVTEDKKYFDLTKDILIKLTDYYTLRNKHNLNIQWYAFSRINALVAFDWIYNDLTKKERTEIGAPLLEAINYMPLKERGNVFRRNTGDYKTGFYGPPCLPWYAGLVFHKTGINDSLSVNLLRQGYDDYIKLLEYRSNIAGEPGGAPSASLNYAMAAYPWAEFIFFHTFNSATDIDISKKWPYVPRFLNYIIWNWLPGDKEYGSGDVYHITNDLPLGSMHMHLQQMIHFYGETEPELISLAKWMQQKTEKKMEEVIPFSRFLLTNTHDEIKPQGPPANMRLARHFLNMGQIFMRSGSGDNDTYALFSSGGILAQHRQYDNNNFIIFKKGYLAMDTGTRPEPGLHLPFYYARTVAHNCVTVYMPGEKMTRYWNPPSINEQPEPPHPNDGGQNTLIGSKVIAFDEKAQYAYIASDATEAYNKDKAKLVVRQFVFLPPNHFVVFDKVNSTNPNYNKSWLLHTAKEPVIKDNGFYADHWQGRLFCKTLFPEKAKLTKIGGPGKQFWNDGRNWPLPTLVPEDWGYNRRNQIPPDTLDLLGQWRMEVTPAVPKTDDIFLHLIQVGENSVNKMVDSELIKTDDMIGVRFVAEEREYELMFNSEDKTGGKITINKNGQKILEENLSDRVMEQEGLF